MATDTSSTAIVSCQEMANSTTVRMTNDSSWLTTSVIRVTIWENSCVSVVMRLMMRPARNWSKNDRSWLMTASNASTRRSAMTVPVMRASSRRRSQLAHQISSPVTSDSPTRPTSRAALES